ncbi:MAG: glycosyltransferase family 39 protein [Candidatus Curtissbacteria bacterium]|nr:glycosyltransferase family 39 protein [Candidatus Curtissbacteria bacterium]
MKINRFPRPKGRSSLNFAQNSLHLRHKFRSFFAQNKDYVVLAIILILGLSLRLWRINIPLLEFEPSRQVQTAEITRNLFRGGFNILQPAVNFYGPKEVLYILEFPGLNTAVAFLYLLNGGVDETLGRLFSVLGWIISFLFLYRISKKLIGEKLSLITVVFYSLSPMSVLVSRSFQPDQWMITLSLGSIFYALIWNEKKKLIYLIISALLASVASLLKIPAFIFTVIPILLLILHQKTAHRFSYSLLYVLISFLPSLIWYQYAYFVAKTNILVNQENFSLSNWFRPALFLDYKYYATVFGWNYNQVILPIGLVLFVVGLFTGYKLPRAKNPRYSLSSLHERAENSWYSEVCIRSRIYLWTDSLWCSASKYKKMKFIYFWLLGIAIYFFIFNRHSMVHEYYNLPFLPVASIFIALGTMKAAKNFRHNWFVYSFIFLMIGISALPQIFTKAYRPIDRFRFVTETGKEVQRLTKQDDLTIGSMDSGPTVIYYSNRNGWSFDIEGKNNPPVNGYRLKSEEYLEYLRSRGAVIFASADKKRLLSNPGFANYMYSKYKTLVENNNFVIFGLTSAN